MSIRIDLPRCNLHCCKNNTGFGNCKRAELYERCEYTLTKGMLSQQEETRVIKGDLISRSSLREVLKPVVEDTSCPLHIAAYIDQFLSQEPAVDPVKHGQWILKDGRGHGVCSQCHRQDHIDPLATHCRYCGAEMDIEE